MTPISEQLPFPAAGDRLASLTGQMIDFVAGLTYEQLPEDVVRKAKWHILDTIACAVAGQDLAYAETARQAARTIGLGVLPVFGATDAQFSAPAAAFANSAIANAMDFDDGFELDGKGMGHPGSTIVMAALTALDGRPVDGRRFITAVVAGYEINNRLIHAMQPSAERFAEVYGISQHQAIGACVAYGLLKGLDSTALENAVGLTGTLTPLPSLHKYNWLERPIVSLKDYVAPAAMAGVLGVEFCLAGLVGSRDLFDGSSGYWRMLGSDRFDGAAFVEGLGESWYVLHGSFKCYPACRWIAPALEGFDRLLQDHHLDAKAIASIEVESFATVDEKLTAMPPGNIVDAQFCLPYCLGVLALRLPPGKDWFAPELIAHDTVLGIASRVQVRVDPDMDAAMSGVERRPSARVIVTLDDGRRLVHEVEAPLGGSRRPVPMKQIYRKALHNLRPLDGQAEAFADWLLDLEAARDIGPRLRSLMNAHPSLTKERT